MKMLITVDGQPYRVEVEILDEPDAVPISTVVPAATTHADIPLDAASPPAGEPGEIESPIAGNVAEVLVKPGDTVSVGDILVVLEVMKMESNVASPFAGTIKTVHVKPGQNVTRHQPLISF
ncbi:MAG: biotin/lipoyl-containing protein [Planctomycetota bacterium]